MKYFKLLGSGGSKETITFLNIHLHDVTSKQETVARGGSARYGAPAYKNCFDKIARYILDYKCRFAMGDLGKVFFAFAPELRARGFSVQLAGWHCHTVQGEGKNRSDSVGIWVIGPHQGVRLVWDCKELRYPRPVLPTSGTCSRVLLSELDNQTWKWVQREHLVIVYTEPGVGSLLSCFMPKDKSLSSKFIQWTFTPTGRATDPAVENVNEERIRKPVHFPRVKSKSIRKRKHGRGYQCLGANRKNRC